MVIDCGKKIAQQNNVVCFMQNYEDDKAKFLDVRQEISSIMLHNTPTNTA
jgi:hypothetical protein